MKISRLMLSIAIVAALSVCAAAQQNTPKATIEAFYKFDRANSQAFNRANLDARKAWFSPELYKLFENELKREAEYLKANPSEKPFFGDGMPFQPLDEACKVGTTEVRRGLVVKQEFQRTAHAAVTATFAYPKTCKEGGEPVVYTIGLVKSNGRWVIDDVNYGEDTSLKQRLQRKEY